MLKHLEVDPDPLSQLLEPHRDIEIVYEDDWLVVINKPHELLSVPGKLIEESVQTRMRKRYPEADEPMMIHRLDMSTSGLMVLSLKKRANKKLQGQFISREVKKRYVALLDGQIPADKGEINLPLRLDLDNRPNQLVDTEHGKNALTFWRKIGIENGRTRVYFYPQTGRTHQLRVHAAHIEGLNCPIVGDELYGKPGDRLHLHANMLQFTHPVTKKRMSFKRDPEF